MRLVRPTGIVGSLAVLGMVILILVSVAACAGSAGGTGRSSPGDTGTSESPGRSTGAPVQGSPGGGATPTGLQPSVSASPGPPPTAQAGGTDAPAEPPAAALGGVRGGSVRGVLGTFTYDGSGSDSPWIPGRALQAVRVTPGARVAIRLEGGVSIGSWVVRIAAAGDADGSTARVLAASPPGAPSVDEIELTVPGVGTWVIAAEISYGDGSGSGAYFWRLNVP